MESALAFLGVIDPEAFESALTAVAPPSACAGSTFAGIAPRPAPVRSTERPRARASFMPSSNGMTGLRALHAALILGLCKAERA